MAEQKLQTWLSGWRKDRAASDCECAWAHCSIKAGDPVATDGHTVVCRRCTENPTAPEGNR